jgi:hypothetical protein
MVEVRATQGQVLSYECAGRPRGSRIAKTTLAAALIYPLLPLMALYVTWVIAWMVLGHRPRSSLDDPKFIGGPVDVAYVATALLLMSLPVGIPAGITVGTISAAWYVYLPGWNWLRYSMLILAILGAYVGSGIMLQWDPLRVLYWYMD